MSGNLIKECFCVGRSLRSPDLDVVDPANVIERAESDEALLEGNVVCDHDRSKQVVDIESHCALLSVSYDTDFSPFFDAPIKADCAKIGDWSAWRVIDYEYVVSVFVAGLGYMDIHEVARILEAEEEAMISMGVAVCFFRIRMLLHEFLDGDSLYAGLLNINLHDEVAKGEALDQRYIQG